MEDEKYQKELFEFKKPKRILPRLSDFFPKADFERNVVFTLTLDRIVFLAIGLIMLMVVVYALGVESGRRGKPETRGKAAATVPARQVFTQAAVIAKQGVTMPAQSGRTTAAQAALAYHPARPVEKKAQPLVKASPVAVGKTVVFQGQAKISPMIAGAGKPYTILVVTFSNKDTAIQELAKLRKIGYFAEMVQSGRFYQIRIGAYADKAGSLVQNDLKKVRRVYSDASIRLR